MAAAEQRTLADVFEIKARFKRSVNLERDALGRDALEGYLVTPLGVSVLDRILLGLKSPTGQRAWSLTGPYGSGKSAFGVLATSALCPTSEAHQHARALLKPYPREGLGYNFRKGGLADRGGLAPILITGERARLDLALLRRLSASLGKMLHGRRNILQSLKQRIESTEKGAPCGTSDLVRLVEESAAAMRESNSRANGLLLIVDELGKFLEHAAENPANGDPYLLQALAEAANRSGDTPIVVVASLHQAFERYAARLGQTQRSEWAKVQGRFEDVAYQEKLQEVLQLTATAIIRKHPGAVNARAYQEIATVCARPIAKAIGLEPQKLAEVLASTAPLDPTTALVLGPVFRAGSAQNERSLFAFLSSAEPHGFQAFARRTAARPTEAPTYRLADLYDYLVANLGPSLIAGPSGKRWALVEEAISRLDPESAPTDGRLVKTIGLLAALGASSPIQATTEGLRLALIGDQGATEVTIKEALSRLSSQSLVVYRRYSGTYGLWEGSDFDIDALIAASRDRFSASLDVPAELQRLHPPRPLVAKRHLLRTGTLRFFDVRYVSARAVLNRQGAVLADESPEADGLLLFVIPDSEDEAEALRVNLRKEFFWLTSPSRFDRPTILAIPDDGAHIREAVEELASIDHAKRETAGLETDPVAKRELFARAAEALSVLEQQLNGLFGRAQQGKDLRGTFYTQVDDRPVSRNLSSRGLSELASDLCDRAYRLAPEIHNELINRRHPSSAAASGRRVLIDAMLTKAVEPGLGFEGSPPERAIYRALLERHGLHRQVGGQWRIAAPPRTDRSMGPVWGRIVEVLSRHDGQRVSVEHLYRAMTQPPFGLKEGVLPVLLTAVLVDLDSELALYEEGAFVARVTPAVLERLTKAPGRFELQRSRLDGARARVLDRLARTFLAGSTPSQNVVVAVVRRFAQLVTELPNSTLHTKRLSSRTIQVRDALVYAKEPADLLFRALPTACGVSEFRHDTPDADVDAFLGALQGALSELEDAFARLCDQIASMLSSALGLPTGLGPVRAALQERAKPLLPVAPDPKLKSFLVRAADLSNDDRGWLQSLATSLSGKPPVNWADPDLEAFHARLALMARSFVETERLVAHRGTGNREVLQLSIATLGAPERAKVVRIDPADARQVREAEKKLLGFLRAGGFETRPELALAVLGRAADQLLSEMEDAESVLPTRVPQ
ncbi:MAG: hypothetical protein HYV07_27515 [Deltaproteobacteria bacterium]|nr:hypothetical protein [Deltaproteobacteria bacterium]